MVDPLTKGILIIVFTLVFGAIIIYFILVWKRSHRLRVRDSLNRKAYVNDYWIFEKKDRSSGVMYWVSVLGKRTLKTPKPPNKAIEIGRGGRKFAECYRVSEDEFIWVTDEGISIREWIDEHGETQREYVDVGKDGTYTTIDSFKPFSVVQRESIITQFKKAQEMRSKRWTADKIVAMTSIIGLVMLIIMLMVFWSDLAAPIVKADERITAREQRLYSLEQRLCDEIKGVVKDKPQDIPPQPLIETGGEAPP